MSNLRERIVAVGWWGVANEKRIHYRQVRPIDGLGQPYKLDLWTDCSGFVTCCYAWAGGPDPNGEDFDGDGFTGTLLGHCQHVSRGQLQPADLIVFGAGTGEHVVMVLKGGPDPLCVSHGTEGGPLAIPLSKEVGYHRPPVTYLRCPGLDDPEPTPPVPPQEDDDMHHAYFVQRDGAGPADPCWVASMTIDPVLVEDLDVAHVVAFCTGVTIHPVPDVAKKGAATRNGKTETTWLLDAQGERYFHIDGK